MGWAMTDLFFELVDAVYPFGLKRRYVALLTFKMDESSNGRTFVVGGLLADTDGWRKIHATIAESLEFENSQLSPELRIRRYHATEMNNYDNDYEMWDNAEGKIRVRRMTDKMIAAIASDALAGFSIGLDLEAHGELFPHKDKSDPYILCMQFVMQEIGQFLAVNNVDEKALLIQDNGDYNAESLTAYKVLTEDAEWKYRDSFLTLTPLKWQDDVGLQASDAIAYETYRELDRQLFPDSKRRNMRKPLEVLTERFPYLRAKHLDREVLEAIKADELQNANAGVLIP
jgi:hypothetical protein